ncbi:adenylate cyclase type 1-like [Microtus ochrogaster]|uniref:Adenylate cyclase type 1-like n=1 Tax=Microtus ochrogaster TaxID=79684 RepID=A0ABM1AV04_MICOH|nr:adenylate cyclase type 1-like [Microtus ochrogaster]
MTSLWECPGLNVGDFEKWRSSAFSEAWGIGALLLLRYALTCCQRTLAPSSSLRTRPLRVKTPRFSDLIYRERRSAELLDTGGADTATLIRELRTEGGAERAAGPGGRRGLRACGEEFACPELEALFRGYTLRLEQAATLKALAVLSLLAGSLALAELLGAPGPTPGLAKGSHPVHCILFLALFVVTNVRSLQVSQLQQVGQLALFFSLTFALLCCPFALGGPARGSAGGAVGAAVAEHGVWQLLLVTFVSYALLPVRSLLVIGFGLVVAASHLLITAALVPAKRPRLWRTLGANALLFVGVNMYGVFVRILTERSQRKAFLQARSCIEDRLRLEDENEKQGVRI